jgi:hypothetical protein
MQIEAHLQTPRETLQIPYPAGFPVSEKTYRDDDNLTASYEPRYYTEAEIKLIEEFLPRLNYTQSLVQTGAVLVGNDPLLECATHDILDAIETAQGYVISRYLDADIERALRERVYLVRELGYRGMPASVIPSEAPSIVEPVTERKTPEKGTKGREVSTAA